MTSPMLAWEGVLEVVSGSLIARSLAHPFRVRCFLGAAVPTFAPTCPQHACAPSRHTSRLATGSCTSSSSRCVGVHMSLIFFSASPLALMPLTVALHSCVLSWSLGCRCQCACVRACVCACVCANPINVVACVAWVLVQTVGWDAFGAIRPRLLEVVNSDSPDDVRVRQGTVAEVAAGFMRGLAAARVPNAEERSDAYLDGAFDASAPDQERWSAVLSIVASLVEPVSVSWCSEWSAVLHWVCNRHTVAQTAPLVRYFLHSTLRVLADAKSSADAGEAAPASAPVPPPVPAAPVPATGTNAAAASSVPAGPGSQAKAAVEAAVEAKAAVEAAVEAAKANASSLQEGVGTESAPAGVASTGQEDRFGKQTKWMRLMQPLLTEFPACVVWCVVHVRKSEKEKEEGARQGLVSWVSSSPHDDAAAGVCLLSCACSASCPVALPPGTLETSCCRYSSACCTTRTARAGARSGR